MRDADVRTLCQHRCVSTGFCGQRRNMGSLALLFNGAQTTDCEPARPETDE
jgi:hypothetical protein